MEFEQVAGFLQGQLCSLASVLDALGVTSCS